MSKIPVIPLVALVLAALVGYLALDPDAARAATNWVRRQAGSAPKVPGGAAPNYMPIVR